MKRYCILIALAVGVTASADSFDSPLCITAQNSIEKNKCLDSELKVREAELDAAFQIVLAKLQAADKESPMFQVSQAFSKSQANWKVFRKAECSARSLRLGYGTGAPSEFSSCMIELSAQRIETFKSGSWSN